MYPSIKYHSFIKPKINSDFYVSDYSLLSLL